MHPLSVLRSLVLLALANGTPVIAKRVFGPHFAFPLDGGLTFFDARPLFGTTKTIRGVVLAILITAIGAPLVGVRPEVGGLVAIASMAGDLFSSFVKRRLHRASSSRALGLDQVPESLLPLLLCHDMLSLTLVDVAVGVASFFVGEIVLSRLLYRIHVRDQPY
jgi:CDP-2,3-bis-(O-geranylgeranyl)-sn-glycerol synthase